MTEKQEKIINQSVKMLTISEDEAGQRIDNYLLAKLKGVPKSLIYRILRKEIGRASCRERVFRAV